MQENSNDFDDDDDDELDEYEESHDEAKMKKKGTQAVANQKYDEAYELSQDLSMAESFDGRDKDKEKVTWSDGVLSLSATP